MAYAGKSFIGPILARKLLMQFLDTDLLIQSREAATLQGLIEIRGSEAFKLIEESHVCSVQVAGHVIATGGSVVYSERSMNHLRSIGKIVYLDVPLPELIKRARGMSTRGLIISAGMTFEDLFHERKPLYNSWADLTIKCRGRSPEKIVQAISDSLAELI